MSSAPSLGVDRSLWSIQMWWENICTLMSSSAELLMRRLRRITLCTAFAGGEVMLSEIGRPMLSPNPVKPEFAPRPTIVLSEVTSVIAVSVMVPLTWMTNGPDRWAKLMKSAAVDTVTVGPPAPPVVPFCPRALTPAQPSATPLAGGGLVGGGVVGGGVVGGGVVGRGLVGVGLGVG